MRTRLSGWVALLHLYFLVLEMFFWNKPLGCRVFGLTPGFAQASAALAANQGLYNPRKSSQPQMNADKRGYSMHYLYSPAHQKGEWPRCIHDMIHLR